MEQPVIENIQNDIWSDFARAFRKPYLPLAIIATLLFDALLFYQSTTIEFNVLTIRLFLLFFILPWLFVLVPYIRPGEWVRANFWKAFAARNGFSYLKRMDPVLYSGVRPLLLQPKGKEYPREMRNIVTGEYQGGIFRVYEYVVFDRGALGSAECPYTIFEFDFRGNFPHTYLNYRNDRRNISAGVRLTLPPELEKNFQLSVADQYEIEALEIFTPDILEFIEHQGWKMDMELLDGSLFIFRPRRFNTLEDLEVALKAATTLADRLAPVLTGFSYEKIGTNSPLLTRH